MMNAASLKMIIRLLQSVGLVLIVLLSSACSSGSDNSPPVISILNVRQLEGDSGNTNYIFTISMSKAWNADVTVNYATSDGTATTADNDYTAASGTLTISQGSLSTTRTILVTGDTIYETNEYFNVTLSNPTSAVLGTSVAKGIILNDDVGGLNDTGIDVCSSPDQAFSIACTGQGSGNTRQDADFGLDYPGDGDANGSRGFNLTVQASGCVLDNNTKLMWEAKTNDNGLRDAYNTYRWYDSNTATNGGVSGDLGTDTCNTTLPGSLCNTQAYVAAVNANNYCGYNDWRLPTASELRSLIDYNKYLNTVMIVTAGANNIFPNAINTRFWTSQTDSGNNFNAYAVNFNEGNDSSDAKISNLSIRLVRDAP